MVRAWVLILLVATLCALAGCATSPAPALSDRPQSADASPVMTVKWLPPCEGEEPESYFSVDVLADGTVRYVGGRQAKEVGELRKQITQAEVQRLLRDARQFVSNQPAAAKRAGTATSVDPSYCLDVTLRNRDGQRTGLERSDARRSRPMIRTLREIVQVEKWACPARLVGDSESNLLNTRAFCQDAANPTITTLRLADERTCFSFHSIHVHADGLAYYSALAGSSSRPGYHTVFDAYFQLPPDALTRLIDEINRSRLVHPEMLAESPTEGPLDIVLPDFTGFAPADMKRLKEKFATELGLHWFTFSGDWPGCQYSGPPSEVWLNAGYGPEGSKKPNLLFDRVRAEGSNSR